MKLCIIIPAYNEEAAIAQTISDYRASFPDARIVVIDNNSKDATAERALEQLDPSKDILMTETRQGKGFAIKTGLSRLKADIYIMTDGDATYPASDASGLLDEMLKTRADIIVGDRISGGAYASQNKRAGHGWGNKLLTLFISRMAGKKYADVLSGLRIMSKPFVDSFDVRSTGFQLETEMNVVAAYLRTDIREIPVSYLARPDGSDSKLNTIGDGWKIINFALNNWIAFLPLQPFVFLSAFMMVIGGALTYRVVAGFLATGWPYSTTAIAAAVSIIIAILSLFFGVALKIVTRNDRRREIARFLTAKREWNESLDEKHA